MKKVILILLLSVYMFGENIKVTTAIKSAYKIDSAFGMGMSFIKFENLLYDAKYNIEEAVESTNNNKIKTELKVEILESYLDAYKLWNFSISARYRKDRTSSFFEFENKALWKILNNKYNLVESDSLQKNVMRIFSYTKRHIKIVRELNK